ncbi:MAG: PAC2 family protein [Chloroflexi bacterium]|nr:PAC2 family protein [Chloroflexota bacterium]
MLTILSEPELRSPVLLCGVSGWSDAATAASGALRYLLQKRPAEIIARFEPDDLYVYTITRPLVEIGSENRRVVRWPDFAFHAIRVPDGPHDLVLLTGPEPDIRWRAVADAAADHTRRLGVYQLITLGCFYAPVHYARAPIIVASSSIAAQQRQLRSIGSQESGYQGPTGFLSALTAEVEARGIARASIWTAAPSYLPNLDNPKLAAALLEVVERLLGQGLWRAELEAAGRDLERRVREVLHQRPDLVKSLERLDPGEQEKPEPAASEGEAPRELPTTEEVLREAEEHFRRLRGEDADDQPRGQ